MPGRPRSGGLFLQLPVVHIPLQIPWLPIQVISH
ncbi:hypothetical protein CIB84_015636 [Bambusicola thoracicus]|uniref:Uncharacterized protein n=1 Tax=Bambusicola thoracicus TaxID=9083 RepID=A0A2P4S943_BAMTH|nr:hypothetical protein CIB84_015636 [Bambusicola thoracicus]